MYRNPELVALERSHGIIVPMASDFVDRKLAFDAQPVLVTASNAGIPAYLTNFMDPEIIRVLFAPMKAAEIYGERKQGDWITATTTFQLAESTGYTSAYGDYNTNGRSGMNPSWEERQSFTYQTMTEWGEMELERAGAARINYAQELSISSALTLNKYQNKTYFFGVSGLRNYGGLNDPSLSASIAPGATGTGAGTTWSTKDGSAIYADIQLLFRRLISQTSGLVDNDTKMILAMSPSSNTYFTNTNSFNVNVVDQVKKNLPNLEVMTAPEFATASGNMVQLIVPEYEGQRTTFAAFTEKMRAHTVIPSHSSWSQKKSQGTWGTVIRRPMFIASMIGV